VAYTDHADLYGAIHEGGLNRTIEHVQRKRPSLFNYGTDRVAENPEDLMCRPIDAAREVTDNGNPLVTPQDPVPVIGTDGLLALEYGFQIPTVVIDFAPGDELPFPEGSDLAVGEQEFGIGVEVCAGLACPGEEQTIELAERIRYLRNNPDQRAELEEPIVPRPRELHCFCLYAFVVGEVEMDRPGIRTPTFTIDETPQFHLDDIAISGGGSGGETAEPAVAASHGYGSTLELPDGLRRSMECYLKMTIEFGVLPEIADAVANVVPRLVRMLEDMFDLAGTTLAVSTPTSAAVPNNPALQDDELQLHVDATIGRPSP
jgi:hypothetical protein